MIYFFFVETKGRTLEELDVVFESKDPRKASTQMVSICPVRIPDEKESIVELGIGEGNAP